MENFVFDPERRNEVNKIIKDAIKATLAKSNARENGILMTGKGRGKKAKNFTLGFMFRDPQSLPKDGTQEMMVGHKEMVFEVQPGFKPPYFLRCRIVKGESIDPKFQMLAMEVFREVKDEGCFEISPIHGVEEVVKRLVRAVSEISIH